MPESQDYFDLPLAEQAELLLGLAPVLGRRAEILEKDIWLCLALGALFTLPCRKPMAFKGGTSLSKVYQAIERFSEDIDVTIDYRSLIQDAPDLATLSNSQRRKLSDALKAALVDHVTKELVPALQAALAEKLPGREITLEISEDAEKLWLLYPSAVENTDAYLRPSVLIEFGGRNATLPQDTLTITPDVAPHVPAVTFPSAQVTVLSPMRTFWEKATLIHVECHRPDLRAGADRLSRHWYDLARLADHEVGLNAVADVELLKDVLHIKETFFRSGYSQYDLCLSGGLRLIPDAPLLDALSQDYQAMLSAQMFYGETLPFERIVERLTALEKAINQR
ncbi:MULTISPECIES: nucleotidyl transferase AbiEii/AbiGii toxin family protein [Burkholderiaceae]|uniref:Nucleotidyl transferase AbiEii/AbiGii toxin family protein n=1 Tax=Burkholderia cepacia TaxID=292 RepID=A0A8I1AR18_BURCE|nr:MULTISPECIES: nucleotidyl transferase AbiEii/AbiGii toxin family protein [Burkholderiaceae]MBB0025228.1 nucleotidyl transferase AbiEii/AbiGii toxin family protein [Ralstonia pickettii]MBB0036016.1 nucleotidyl transferase AbiEii/AbiGii toxin family protein [Ralstonia pickettii]MBB0098556.1 nucleotidyl transferase AbiEii/AbiGii toxin family protein [Ralstonia pickettii]MBB0108385.1 nucleotidyl transferase AbiEii/AbiGii toxin family protein [Ralstonia pickettii]MBB0129330.1 nucleotidyl transfe